jgi:hypothetical protein
MRKDGRHLDKYRKVHPRMGDSPAGALYGYFRVPVGKRTLEVISSGERHSLDGLGSWEHVSVSVSRRPDALPMWGEMCEIKKLFWMPSETVVQFHPAESEYVNVYNCLHLWLPPYDMALPPKIALA